MNKPISPGRQLPPFLLPSSPPSSPHTVILSPTPFTRTLWQTRAWSESRVSVKGDGPPLDGAAAPAAVGGVELAGGKLDTDFDGGKFDSGNSQLADSKLAAGRSRLSSSQAASAPESGYCSVADQEEHGGRDVCGASESCSSHAESVDGGHTPAISHASVGRVMNATNDDGVFAEADKADLAIGVSGTETLSVDASVGAHRDWQGWGNGNAFWFGTNRMQRTRQALTLQFAAMTTTLQAASTLSAYVTMLTLPL